MNAVDDSYLKPSFDLYNQLRRLIWGVIYVVFFRTSPRPFHAWRSFLLRCFGARIGANCHIYPHAKIWAPWNLECEDVVGIADEAVIYNPSKVVLGSHATVSQQAFLCGASHDYNDPNFQLISKSIHLEPHSWICARATVQMGVRVGEGAVLALGGVATSNLQPWTVYGGIPARPIRVRKRLK